MQKEIFEQYAHAAPEIDMSSLKNRGGKGELGIEIVGGSVLTLKENAALVIAKDIIQDVERRTGNKLPDIPLGAFVQDCHGRSKPNLCTGDEILLELSRLRNHSIYGDSVPRR